jgi:Glyoxalase-like domain
MAFRGVPLQLDHASVWVPDLATAVEHLDWRLGLRATVTPEAPERHSRVYLDRSYLEVAAEASGAVWASTFFFLRFDDPDALRAHLEDAGIEYRFSEYKGVDGTWDDVEIRAGAVPFPILVRRTAPDSVARDWPPPLAVAHRCGARMLAAVHVEVPSLEEAADAYRRLLGEDHVSWPDDERRQGHEHVRLASGGILLEEAVHGGLGLVLGVRSLEATRAALDGRLARTDESVAWLDPDETFGLRLGFAECE